MEENKRKKVLEMRNLSISFTTNAGLVNAIRGVNLDVYQGETLAIVGESGSGKSVTAKAIMGILDKNSVVNSGTILFRYRREDGSEVESDLAKLDKKDFRKHINGKRIAMVFQDPMTSLDPTMTVGRQIMEGMIWHFHTPTAEAKARAIALLEEVGIPEPKRRMKQYPHQLSGGMRQRVVIAIALACNPELLICDEPTTALDVTIQAKILELIQRIQRERGISIIYITHDLGVVAKVADYVNVMYAGKIVEKGTIDEIFFDPRHPYTWGCFPPCRIWTRGKNAFIPSPARRQTCCVRCRGMRLRRETSMRSRLTNARNRQCFKFQVHIMLLRGCLTRARRR